jgi:hypothetical protein
MFSYLLTTLYVNNLTILDGSIFWRESQNLFEELQFQISIEHIFFLFLGECQSDPSCVSKPTMFSRQNSLLARILEMNGQKNRWPNLQEKVDWTEDYAQQP